MLDREAALITITHEAAELAQRPLSRANAEALRRCLREATRLLDDLPRLVVDNGR